MATVQSSMVWSGWHYRLVCSRSIKSCPCVSIFLLIVFASVSQSVLSQSDKVEEQGIVKFAITSPAWHADVETGMRLMVQNLTDRALRLKSIHFYNEIFADADNEVDEGSDDAGEASKDSESTTASSAPLPAETIVDLDLLVSADGWAESNLAYTDLLAGNRCVSKSLASADWQLAEISNYALNPSVRSFIIEDIDSFRVYSCTRTVRTVWVDIATDEIQEHTEWVLYHFERRTEEF